MSKRKERLVQATISGLSKRGNGLGQTDESALDIEVPFTFPGDVITASIKGKKKGVYPGRLTEILQPSPLRIAPKCIHFGSCGGCRLQHIPYEEQLIIKQRQVRSYLASVITAQTEVGSILPCDPPWNYRNKMEFTFSSDKKGQKYLGLILCDSGGKVLNLTECHLVNPWMVDALKAVREWWEDTNLQAYHPYSDRGSLRTLIVREGMTSQDRLIMLTVSGNPEYPMHKTQLESFSAYLRAAIEPIDPNVRLCIFLRIQQAIRGQPTQFYEMLLYGPDTIRETLDIASSPQKKLNFQISPTSFFQPNTRQAEKLYSQALQMAALDGTEVVYDLYCGTGTLGLVFADFAKEVIGVELSEEASLDACENAKRNEVNNIRIFTGSCDVVLHKIREEKSLPKPNLILLDPPRSGLELKAIEEILLLDSAKILYISCNPETQARDIHYFVEAGYALVKIQPVDQFPQTMHIENIALLKK